NDLLRVDRDQRGEARRFPDDCAPADQRERPAPPRDGERKVERRDDSDHAQRVPLFDQPVVASLGRNLPAEELPGLPDREVTDIDDLLDLAASLAQDLAVLEADEPCQVLFSCAKTIAEPAHDLA